jgi:hypothetical protein
MTYKSVEHGFVFWQEALLLPMKKRPGEKQKYFRKEIDFEDAPNYWEYICEDGSWNVYYVKRGVNRRLAQCNIGKFSPESIIARLSDKDISVNDCRKVEEKHGKQVNRTPITGLFWSKEYDGKSVLELMEKWPKMPYAHVKMVIENEGGFIDNKGIIHKGLATEQTVVTID